MNNKVHYLVVSLMALALYTFSMVLGGVINVLIVYATGYTGYEDYSQYKMQMTDNISFVLVVLIISILNHILFSLLTVRLIGKYALKRNFLSNKCFIVSAVVVFVFGAIVYPIILSSSSGWLTYAVHIGGILLFGKRYISDHSLQISTTNSTYGVESGDAQSLHESDTRLLNNELPVCDALHSHSTVTNTDICYCHICGAKISADSIFCSKCGARIK